MSYPAIIRRSPYGFDTLKPRMTIVHAMGYQIDVPTNIDIWYPKHKYPELNEAKGERVYAATWLELIKLSAHVLIAPDGTQIRCRGDREGAWHAKGHNRASLGAEFLVEESYNLDLLYDNMEEPWISPESDQFWSGVEIFSSWHRRHNISVSRMRRHSDVSPERKRDPGSGFPWEQFKEEVANHVESP